LAADRAGWASAFRQLVLERGYRHVVIPADGTYTLLFEGRIYDGAGTLNYGFNVIESPTAAPVRISALEARPAPDLTPTEVSVSTTGPLQSGAAVTVAWKTSNIGSLPTGTGAWTERVVVRNLDTGEIVGNLLVPYTAGALAGGASQQRQATLTLPEGNRGAGRLSFTVTVDVSNAVEEENSVGTGEANNAVTLERNSALAPYADLEVRGWPSVRRRDGRRGPGHPDLEDRQCRQRKPVGRLERAHCCPQPVKRPGRKDRHRRLQRWPRRGSRGGAQPCVTWPAGLNSTGLFEFLVTTDIHNDIFEANASGNAEALNSAEVEIVSAPDLRLANLRVTSSSVGAGGAVELAWDESNDGNAASLSGWNNRVVVRNITTGEVLLDSIVATAAALAPGQSRAKTFSFGLPHGTRGAGQIEISVTADRNANGTGSVLEVKPGINAEANNGANITVTSAAVAYPDLRTTNLLAPPTWRGGTEAEIGWTVTNAGGAAATGSDWVDRVILSKDAIFGNADDVILGEFARTSPLAASATYSVKRNIALPLGLEGEYRLTVRTDAKQSVLEPDTRADNDAAPALVALTSPAADLATEAVFGPNVIIHSGDSFEVSWRVRNIGENNAVGPWTDRVILSSDNVVDANDLVLAEFTRSASLAPGETYTVRQDVKVPDGRTGTFRPDRRERCDRGGVREQRRSQ
jgi:hypothetical protein